MIDDQQKLEDAWLGLDVDNSELFNPMDFVVSGAHSVVNDAPGVFFFCL